MEDESGKDTRSDRRPRYTSAASGAALDATFASCLVFTHDCNAMLKLIPSLILLLAVLALPAAAPAQTAGIDEYTESPPSVNGNNPPEDGATTSTTDGSTDPGATGTAVTDASTDAAPTEAQAAADGTPAGQLPATGLETPLLALAGVMLAAAGYGIRRALGPGAGGGSPGNTAQSS